MKKSLFIALFLVLSSFFFISVKEVEAYEYSFDVDFSLINDKFFLFKEKVDQFVKEDDSKYLDDYFIYYYDRNYYVIFFNINNTSYYDSLWFRSSSSIYLKFNDKFSYVRYSMNSNNNLIINGSKTYLFTDMYTSFVPLYSTFSIDFMSSQCGVHKFTFTYNDWSYEYLSCDSSFKTLYDLKIIYDQSIKDLTLIHKEEFSNISNFYTICIEKIKYLGEQITSNYIYLSMVVVLILIFIIELIRRWLL